MKHESKCAAAGSLMKLINEISLKVILNFSSLIDRYAPKRLCDVSREAVGRLVLQRHTRNESPKEKNDRLCSIRIFFTNGFTV